MSVLPPFCVPFKRYAAACIESCLDSVLRAGGSVQQWCDEAMLTDRSTAGNWVGQFRDQTGTLATDGTARLGCRQPHGSAGAAGLWAVLREWAGKAPVLPAVQSALCGAFPFLGMFRPRL